MPRGKNKPKRTVGDDNAPGRKSNPKSRQKMAGIKKQSPGRATTEAPLEPELNTLDNKMSSTQSLPKNATEVRWRAYEFYYHQKRSSWYALAFLGAIMVSVLGWVISGFDDYLSSVIIFIALTGLIFYAAKRPDKKDYSINPEGLKINGQSFSFGSFRHFWVEYFDTHTEITLVGSKRTAPPISLYIKDKDLADLVIRRIGVKLPEDSPSRNPFDWITRKIKF